MVRLLKIVANGADRLMVLYPAWSLDKRFYPSFGVVLEPVSILSCTVKKSTEKSMVGGFEDVFPQEFLGMVG